MAEILLLTADSGDTYGVLATFAGSSVGGGPLSTNRQPFAMTNATVAIDRLQTLHVHLELTSKVTFDHDFLALDHSSDRGHLIGSQFSSSKGGINVRLIEDFLRCYRPNSVNVWKRSLDTLVVGNVYAEQSSHKSSLRVGKNQP